MSIEHVYDVEPIDPETTVTVEIGARISGTESYKAVNITDVTPDINGLSDGITPERGYEALT